MMQDDFYNDDDNTTHLNGGGQSSLNVEYDPEADELLQQQAEQAKY